MLELPTNEAEDLFDILDEDKVGELDIKTFVEGAFRLKGSAKSALEMRRDPIAHEKRDPLIVH